MKDIFSLAGRSAAVVGAGSGIGEAVAVGCAEAGARVYCLDIDADGAARTAAAIREAGRGAGGVGVTPVPGGEAALGAGEAPRPRAVGGEPATSAQLDILDGAAVTAAFEAIAADHGSLDVVVCTPGVNVRKPLLDYTDDEIDRVLGLNLKGGAHVIQGAGRVMRAQGSGSIILFSSVRSVVVEPGQSMYAATKAGIVQMVRAAAAELGPHGVRVNAVAPGVIDTPLTAPIKEQPDWYGAYAAGNILERWGSAREMAGPTVFLASDAASYVTGAVLFADGGWTAIDGRFTPPGM